MEQREWQELGRHFDTREARAKFICNAESDLYIGKTEDGREARVFLQKDEGMKVMIEQRGKPHWWEVIIYDAEGYQEGLTYEERFPNESEPFTNGEEKSGITLSQME